MIGTIALACLGLSVNTTVEQRRSLDAHAISATAKALGLASKAKGAIGLIKVAKSVGEARALVKQRQGVTAGLVKFDTAGHPVAHMEPVGCGLFDVWGAMFTWWNPISWLEGLFFPIVWLVMYATCFLIGGPAGWMQDFFAGRKSIPTYGCFNTIYACPDGFEVVEWNVNSGLGWMPTSKKCCPISPDRQRCYGTATPCAECASGYVLREEQKMNTGFWYWVLASIAIVDPYTYYNLCCPITHCFEFQSIDACGTFDFGVEIAAVYPELIPPTVDISVERPLIRQPNDVKENSMKMFGLIPIPAFVNGDARDHAGHMTGVCCPLHNPKPIDVCMVPNPDGSCRFQRGWEKAGYWWWGYKDPHGIFGKELPSAHRFEHASRMRYDLMVNAYAVVGGLITMSAAYKLAKKMSVRPQLL